MYAAIMKGAMVVTNDQVRSHVAGTVVMRVFAGRYVTFRSMILTAASLSYGVSGTRWVRVAACGYYPRKHGAPR